MEYNYKSKFGYLSFLSKKSKFKDLIEFFSKKSDKELHDYMETNNTKYNILKYVNKREEEQLKDLKLCAVKAIHNLYSFKEINERIKKYKDDVKIYRLEKFLIENQIRWRRRIIFALSNVIKSRKLKRIKPLGNISVPKEDIEKNTIKVDSNINQLENALREAEERYAGEEFKTSLPNKEEILKTEKQYSAKELVDNFDDRIKKLESKVETLSHITCSQEIIISAYDTRIKECIKSIEGNHDWTDKKIKEILEELKSQTPAIYYP